MPSENTELKVPAELLEPMKEGLIKLGYATEQTPLTFIQDCYFKYCMVRQTGFNPNVPYALGLLPKELQDQIDGGEEEGPIEFLNIGYDVVTGELTANTTAEHLVVGTSATAKYTVSGTAHTINLVASQDKLSLTGTLSPLAVNGTVITVEDPDANLKSQYTVQINNP